MSTPIQKKKTSMPMLIVLLFLVLIGGGYYYYVTVLSSVPTPEKNNPIPIATTIDWNKQLYQDPSYKNLVNPLRGSVEVGPMGNPKPFVQLTPSEARQ
ncbi:MAG: hypothetical protein Q8P11_00145 [bacterium]|nr:hypothetical protein [bacterium]